MKRAVSAGVTLYGVDAKGVPLTVPSATDTTSAKAAATRALAIKVKTLATGSARLFSL